MKYLEMNERSYILRIVNDRRTGKRIYDIISVSGLKIKTKIYPYGPLWHSKINVRYNIYEDLFGEMKGYFELEKC